MKMLIKMHLNQQLLKGYSIFAPSKNKNSTVLEVIYKN